jgi:hypothetical protein
MKAFVGSRVVNSLVSGSPSTKENRLVLTLTCLGIAAAFVRFVSFQDARAQFTGALVPPEVPRSALYYIMHATQLVLLFSAGLLAVMHTRWRTIENGYLLRFTVLTGAALLMAVRGYSLSDVFSAKLADASGPLPFFISVLVFIGARRSNWIVISRLMVILSILLSLLILLGLSGLEVFSRMEGVARLTGILNALFWPASWVAFKEYPPDSAARRLRFLPIVVFMVGSFFTQTRLYFVMLAAFLLVYSCIQRRRKLPQATSWIMGLCLALWLALFTAAFLRNTRVFENVANVADAFSARLDEDTRTGQLEAFFTSVQLRDLIAGKGSFAHFFWGTVDYDSGPDVGYLSLLFYGGVPLLLAYAATHIAPCLRVLKRRSTNDWRLAAAGVVALWSIILFSSAYPGTVLEYYPVLFCVGACISRDSGLSSVRDSHINGGAPSHRRVLSPVMRGDQNSRNAVVGDDRLLARGISPRGR